LIFIEHHQVIGDKDSANSRNLTRSPVYEIDGTGENNGYQPETNQFGNHYPKDEGRSFYTDSAGDGADNRIQPGDTR
jgi:hypothetical protein